MATTTIKQASKNPHVQAAAVELLAVNLKHADITDEYGEEAGEVLTRCLSQMGLPSSDQKLTPKQQTLDDAVTEAIQGLCNKMEAALVKARLLRSERRQSQQKAA
jgi:hypothetical protein